MAGGVLGTCCGLPTVALVVLGVLGATGDDATAPSSTRSAAPSSDEPDDFVYRAANGLQYVAASSVSAEGVQVTLVGEWRDNHRNLTLRLREGGRYELTGEGGVLVGTSNSRAVAYGSKSAEQGTWNIEGSTLTLSPEGADLSGSVGTRRLDTTAEAVDGPRQWNVVGVTLDYTPYGGGTVRQRPGLHVSGPAPSWYYPPGSCDWVLRSAPWSG